MRRDEVAINGRRRIWRKRWQMPPQHRDRAGGIGKDVAVSLDHGGAERDDFLLMRGRPGAPGRIDARLILAEHREAVAELAQPGRGGRAVMRRAHQRGIRADMEQRFHRHGTGADGDDLIVAIALHPQARQHAVEHDGVAGAQAADRKRAPTQVFDILDIGTRHQKLVAEAAAHEGDGIGHRIELHLAFAPAIGDDVFHQSRENLDAARHQAAILRGGAARLLESDLQPALGEKPAIRCHPHRQGVRGVREIRDDRGHFKDSRTRAKSARRQGAAARFAASPASRGTSCRAAAALRHPRECDPCAPRARRKCR
jgi:hypothetical protein